MIKKRFEEVMQSGCLPTPSGTGLVILRRTQDADCSLEDLLRCIEADPALSGRLLKLANSGENGLVDPATTVHQAAERLGTSAVRGVALSFTLVSSSSSRACSQFDYERYWSYSLACASAARIIAGEHGVIDPGEAFTCALLSRVGLLALASAHPGAFGRLLEECRVSPVSELLAAETRAFDIQHWEVASALMGDWGLPEFFVGAVQSLAHSPRELGEDDFLLSAMAGVLRDASQVAEALHVPAGHGDGPLVSEWIGFLAPVGAVASDRERLRPITEQVQPAWLESCATLRILSTPRAGNGPDHPPATPAPRIASTAALANDFVPASEASKGELAALAPGEIKILAVDDDPRILRLLVHHLRHAGYHVRTAENGEKGLQIVLEDSPHIVVTDLMMPELTGIDLCRALRRMDAGSRTYVVILTAREDEQQVVDAFSAGADDYVTKPFNPRILLARVQAGQRMIELQRQVEADKRLRMDQVAEMGLLTRKLRAAALTDILTELPNRRYALTRLEQEWSQSTRTNRPLSVVMIDIDHFKRINDTYGHDIGDVVLKRTAAVLRAHTRRGDVVCRLGGEEFLVINVNSGLEEAIRCAERLRKAVRENRVVCEGFDGVVTISLGCAERTAAIRDIDDLVKAADEAVYAAKAGGRDTIREALRRLPEAG